MMENTSVYYQSPDIDLSMIRHIAFDMDGTIYKGSQLFPYTKTVFETLEKLGIGYTYLTNNSSKSVVDYLSKIEQLGLPGTKDNIYTSSSATLDYMAVEYPQIRTIYLLGTESLKTEFRANGYRLVDKDSETEPELVLVAFHTNLNYEDLCRCVWWIQQGKPYLATHPDFVCPTDRPTVLVDCGAICSLIESITKRRPSAVPGKPSAAMLQGIMNRYHLKNTELIMVGDRLYTDLEMARRAAVFGVLVLSGEATLDDWRSGSVQPDLVVDNIAVMADLLIKARSINP